MGDVEKELDTLEDEGLNEQLPIIAIALMRNLFLTPDALTTKNRQKLMSYFEANTQIPAGKKGETVTIQRIKVLKIALLITSLLRYQFIQP